MFLNKAHHTGKSYVCSMEALPLINGKFQYFAIYVTLIEWKRDLKFYYFFFQLLPVLFEI